MKPDNIIVTPGGSAWLVDLGLAVRVEHGDVDLAAGPAAVAALLVRARVRPGGAGAPGGGGLDGLADLLAARRPRTAGPDEPWTAVLVPDPGPYPSRLVVPLTVGGERLGALVLADPAAERFGDADVATAVAAAGRAARYAEAQFVALLLDVGTGAPGLAEQLRGAVAHPDVEVDGRLPAVTVSIDVAHLRPGEDLDELPRRAEDSLRRAAAFPGNAVLADLDPARSRPAGTSVALRRASGRQ